MGAEIKTLHHRLGKGECDYSTMKILHLKENPASIKKFELLRGKIVRCNATAKKPCSLANNNT